MYVLLGLLYLQSGMYTRSSYGPHQTDATGLQATPFRSGGFSAETVTFGGYLFHTYSIYLALLALREVQHPQRSTMSGQKTPLVTSIYTADPSAHSFEGRIYVYPSHDVEADIGFNDRGDQYAMEDYHVLSMDRVGAE